jgi:hypothetical protein
MYDIKNNSQPIQGDIKFQQKLLKILTKNILF